MEEAAEGAAGNWGRAVDSPEALLIRESLDADLQAALDALPEPFREVVWLRDVEELSYQEIAGALAIPARHGDVAPVKGRKQLYETLAAQRGRR